MSPDTLARVTRKLVRLRRPDICVCGTPLARGERAVWDWDLRAALCLACADKPELPLGSAPPPATDTVEPFGTRMAPLGTSVVALRDLSVPGTDVALDHVLVGASGVLVVDAHRCRNARVTTSRGGSLIRAPRDLLHIGGRDETERVDALVWKAGAVRNALAPTAFADTPVTAVLCVVDAVLPLLREVEIGTTPVIAPPAVARLATEDGPYGPRVRQAIASVLADGLPIVTSRGRRRR